MSRMTGVVMRPGPVAMHHPQWIPYGEDLL